MTKEDVEEYWPEATDKQKACILVYHGAGYDIGLLDEGKVEMSIPRTNESLDHLFILENGLIIEQQIWQQH